jgi:hypothetical protein
MPSGTTESRAPIQTRDAAVGEARLLPPRGNKPSPNFLAKPSPASFRRKSLPTFHLALLLRLFTEIPGGLVLFTQM